MDILTEEEIGNLEWDSEDLEMFYYEQFAENHPKEARAVLQAQIDKLRKLGRLKDEPMFNNVLEADALDWDTRNIPEPPADIDEEKLREDIADILGAGLEVDLTQKDGFTRAHRKKADQIIDLIKGYRREK